MASSSNFIPLLVFQPNLNQCIGREEVLTVLSLKKTSSESLPARIVFRFQCITMLSAFWKGKILLQTCIPSISVFVPRFPPTPINDFQMHVLSPTEWPTLIIQLHQSSVDHTENITDLSPAQPCLHFPT